MGAARPVGAADGAVSLMGAARPMGAVSPEGKVLPARRLLPVAAHRCSVRKARRRAGASPGVSPPRVYLSVTVPGCVAFPLAGFAGKPRAGTTVFTVLREKPTRKREAPASLFLRKNKDVCAHTWFFENNCIVLRCASGDRRPSFGNGRPASRGRMRRGGSERSGNPATGRLPRGRRNDRHADRRTDTRTYSAKPD